MFIGNKLITAMVQYSLLFTYMYDNYLYKTKHIEFECSDD